MTDDLVVDAFLEETLKKVRPSVGIFFLMLIFVGAKQPRPWF